MTKETSFILEFDETNDKQLKYLLEYLIDNDIKYHVLKSDYELAKEKVYKRDKDNLIKYLENKITGYEMQFSQINGDYGLLNPKIEAYEDILERIKSGKYE